MKLFIFLIIIFQINQTIYSQSLSKFDFFFGYGFYEGYNIGSEYYFNNNIHSMSLSVGYDKLKKRDQESFSLALSYNYSIFKSHKNNLNRFKWQINNKLVFWQLEDDLYLWRAVSLIPSISRKLIIYKNISFLFDVGPAFNIVLYNKRKTYKEVGWPYHVMPNFRILFIF